jgi:hypothetical protein
MKEKYLQEYRRDSSSKASLIASSILLCLSTWETNGYQEQSKERSYFEGNHPIFLSHIINNILKF